MGIFFQKNYVLRIRFFSPSRKASRKRKRGIKFPLKLPLTASSVGLSLTCGLAAAPPAPYLQGTASGAALYPGTAV